MTRTIGISCRSIGSLEKDICIFSLAKPNAGNQKIAGTTPIFDFQRSSPRVKMEDSENLLYIEKNIFNSSDIYDHEYY